MNKNFFHQQENYPFIDQQQQQQPSDEMLANKNFLSSNSLLNQILTRRNSSRWAMGINDREFYSKLDLVSLKWSQSLSSQDKCVIFFVVLSATVLILAHICGVLTNKPSYIVPYFLIKVFNVIISILSMLGFYAYMPDIVVWLRMQPNFPFKQNLLELDAQTLQLVFFCLFTLCRFG